MATEKTFYLETFGCQMNAHDSEKVIGTLRQQGYRQVESEEDAGLILYNTCSIRDKAEQKVFNRLNDYKKLHKAGQALRRAGLRCAAGRRKDLRARARMFRWFRVRPRTANCPRCWRGLRQAKPASRASTTARPTRPSRPNSRRGRILIAATSPSLKAATSSVPIAWCRTRAARSAAGPRRRCSRRRGALPIWATPRFSCWART